MHLWEWIARLESYLNDSSVLQKAFFSSLIKGLQFEQDDQTFGKMLVSHKLLTPFMPMESLGLQADFDILYDVNNQVRCNLETLDSIGLDIYS